MAHYTFGDYSQTLYSINHEAEGAVVPATDGRLFHFYRYDPGQAGDHVGNNSDIRMRIRGTDEVWSTPVVIYDSIYDDRNVHAGVTDGDRFAVFFRKYDAGGASTISINAMYSDDDGDTWSTPQTLTTDTLTPGTGIMVKGGDGSYLKTFIANGLAELWSSSDGGTWSFLTTIIDHRSGGDYPKINEMAIAVASNGDLVAISRDDIRTEEGHNYLQMHSTDNGATWSSPVRTNIGSPHFMSGPFIIFDNTLNRFLVAGCDRRSLSGGGTESEESLWFYSAAPAAIISNPLAWELEATILRPYVTTGDREINVNFYGYPCICPESGGFYATVTDRYMDGTGEDGDIYDLPIRRILDVYSGDQVIDIYSTKDLNTQITITQA